MSDSETDFDEQAGYIEEKDDHDHDDDDAEEKEHLRRLKLEDEQLSPQKQDALRKMQIMQPRPVKQLACGREGTLMLLANGDLYAWTGDSPMPKKVFFLMPSISTSLEKEGGGGKKRQKGLKQPSTWSEDELRRYPLITGTHGRMMGLIDLAIKSGINESKKELSKLDKATLIIKIVRRREKMRSQSDISVLAIAAGAYHYCAITDSPSANLYTWGRNNRGQLGQGDTLARPAPMPVETILDTVTQVACGDFFTMCVCQHGTVLSWGAGESGQLGHLASEISTKMSLSDRLKPTRVGFISSMSEDGFAQNVLSQDAESSLEALGGKAIDAMTAVYIRFVSLLYVSSSAPN